jgi:hypothetical protein
VPTPAKDCDGAARIYLHEQTTTCGRRAPLRTARRRSLDSTRARVDRSRDRGYTKIVARLLETEIDVDHANRSATAPSAIIR